MWKHPLFSEKALLFCDLDSTLIYSHRHVYSDETIWVEELHGHPQSFMTQKTYGYLRTQDWLHITPLTTRNHVQYDRLRSSVTELNMQEVLICNGAVLLAGQQEDTLWREESEKLVSPVLPHLLSVKRIVEETVGSEQVVYSEPFLFYVRAEEPDAVLNLLWHYADPSQLLLSRDARKVYCIPKVLSKGNAARRYARRRGDAHFMAAGDSTLDISMLNAADIGFCPVALLKTGQLGEHVLGCTGWFSDSLCDALENIRSGENRFDK